MISHTRIQFERKVDEIECKDDERERERWELGFKTVYQHTKMGDVRRGVEGYLK